MMEEDSLAIRVLGLPFTIGDILLEKIVRQESRTLRFAADYLIKQAEYYFPPVLTERAKDYINNLILYSKPTNCRTGNPLAGR